MSNNAFLETLIARRSVKSYTSQQVPADVLQSVLLAAQYAPNGMGRQSPRMVVVQNPEVRNLLSKMNAEVMGADSDPFYGAPTVVVVFGNAEAMTCIEDASLVAGNLLNAAHAVGLGGCWIHRARQMFESAQGRELMRHWGIPENFVGVANCILGYQLNDPKPRAPRKADFVTYVS